MVGVQGTGAARGPSSPPLAWLGGKGAVSAAAVVQASVAALEEAMMRDEVACAGDARRGGVERECAQMGREVTDWRGERRG